MDECWTEISGKIEEEVLNKYKVEDSKRGAYRTSKQQELSNTTMVRRLLSKDLLLVQRVQFAAHEKFAEKLN